MISPGIETTADIGDRFFNQIADEGFPGITGYALRRIEQAERGRGNDRLLDGLVGKAFGSLHISSGVDAVFKRVGCQFRQLPGMAVLKGDGHPVRRDVGQV